MFCLTKCHAWILVVCLLTACSESVDIKLKLIASCDDKSVLTSENCSTVRVVIWSLNPEDSLHPDQSPGPIGRDCQYASGRCSLSSEDLLGPGRMVDVLCYNTDPTLSPAPPPVSRGSTNALLFDDSDQGIAGLSMNLLMGRIKGFSPTTVTDPHNQDVYQCSEMAEKKGRFGHASVTLPNGTVLTTGGIQFHNENDGVRSFLSTAEIFDPQTGVHRLLVGPNGEGTMQAPSGRAFHTMTLLDNGLVLIVGGIAPINNVISSLQHAELFDWRTETFSTTQGFLQEGRAHHTATKLANGSVLIAGGAVYSGNITRYLNSASIYDPQTNKFTPIETKMESGRAFHQAVALLGDNNQPNQKVVLFGGQTAEIVEGESVVSNLNTIDIFDTNSMAFLSNQDEQATEKKPTMSTQRSHFCAVALDDGKVMIAGGTVIPVEPLTEDFSYDVTASVEVYDPFDTSSGKEFGTFISGTGVFDLDIARMAHTCNRIDDGSVVIVGGLTGNESTTTAAEIFRKLGTSWETSSNGVGVLDNPRYLHTTVSLLNGWLYLTGGLDYSNELQQQSYFFVPPLIIL